MISLYNLIIRNLKPHPNVIRLLGYIEEPLCIVMKVYKCSLKDYIGFINGNLKEATQFKDANDLLEKTCNGTVVGSRTEQKIKIACDIANGMNRKYSCIILLHLRLTPTLSPPPDFRYTHVRLCAL